MKEELLDDKLNSENQELSEMLNILTILTFIGSGFSILMNVYSYMTMAESKLKIEESIAKLDSVEDTKIPFVNGFMDSALKAIENGPILYPIAILVGVLCIIGALQMRKQKRIGFYIYLGACIIGAIVPIIILGGGFIGGMVLVGSVISILFIILYGVNIKQLR